MRNLCLCWQVGVKNVKDKLTGCLYIYILAMHMRIVDLTFRITTCRSLLAIAFRT